MTHNLIGFPRYVWITYAWYQDQWWTSVVNVEPKRCEDREIVQLLRLSLAIEAMPTPDNFRAENDVALVSMECMMHVHGNKGFKLTNDKLHNPSI